ncbi:MAG: hypothetical protein IPF47_02685 [Gemmatimonadetes bacterium]|nr:hypothetical protein [Gemmatimonadota bacterium]
MRVEEGSVNFRFGEVVKPVAAGQAMMVDAKGAFSEADKSAQDEALAWTSGRLVVVNRTLRQALEQTRRWYGIALVPSDQALMERKVSIDASLDSSKEMIADLEESGSMKFGWDDKTMMLYDIGHVPAAKK